MKWRKKAAESQQLPGALLNKMFVCIDKKLQDFAQRLTRVTNKMKPYRLKWIVIISAGVFSTVCGHIIWSSLQNEKTAALGIAPISIMPLPAQKLNQSAVSGKEYDQIHRFKIYLDSLGRDSVGRLIKANILHHRPHMVDSLRWIEDMYYKQHKN